MSETLGLYAGKTRMIGVAYIVITFFLIPFALIYSTSDLSVKNIKEEQIIEVPVQPASLDPQKQKTSTEALKL